MKNKEDKEKYCLKEYEDDYDYHNQDSFDQKRQDRNWFTYRDPLGGSKY